MEPEQIVKSITQIAQLQLVKSESLERELCIANGKTYISRLVHNHSLNNVFTTSQDSQPAVLSPSDRLSGKISKGKVVFEQVMGKDDIRPGHVEVQIKCSGLTQEGVLVITGADYPITFSHEIGGTVTRVGSGVESFKVGDDVVGFNLDTFSTYQQVPATMLHKLERNCDMEEAVSLLIAYSAAIYGLEALAKVKANENVLILNGTGTSGAAAVKVTQAKGAIPYVIVKTNSEAQFVTSQLSLPMEYVVRLSVDGVILDHLEKITGGHGTDVVFSAGNVDLSQAREAWRCIGRFGRFVDGGRKDV